MASAGAGGAGDGGARRHDAGGRSAHVLAEHEGTDGGAAWKWWSRRCGPGASKLRWMARRIGPFLGGLSGDALMEAALACTDAGRLPAAGRGAARRFEVDAGDRRNASTAVKSSIIAAILVPGVAFVPPWERGRPARKWAAGPQPFPGARASRPLEQCGPSAGCPLLASGQDGRDARACREGLTPSIKRRFRFQCARDGARLGDRVLRLGGPVAGGRHGPQALADAGRRGAGPAPAPGCGCKGRPSTWTGIPCRRWCWRWTTRRTHLRC